MGGPTMSGELLLEACDIASEDVVATLDDPPARLLELAGKRLALGREINERRSGDC